MAYFWSFIGILVVLTGVLSLIETDSRSTGAADVVLIELPAWTGVVDAPEPEAVHSPEASLG